MGVKSATSVCDKESNINSCVSLFFVFSANKRVQTCARTYDSVMRYCQSFFTKQYCKLKLCVFISMRLHRGVERKSRELVVWQEITVTEYKIHRGCVCVEQALAAQYSQYQGGASERARKTSKMPSGRSLMHFVLQSRYYVRSEIDSRLC